VSENLLIKSGAKRTAKLTSHVAKVLEMMTKLYYSGKNPDKINTKLNNGLQDLTDQAVTYFTTSGQVSTFVSNENEGCDLWFNYHMLYAIGESHTKHWEANPQALQRFLTYFLT